jgi:glycosyltransferase involved in cell wall biosynthesis
LESGKGGILYPALDHQSLGQAMVKLAQDRRLCKSMGEEGLRIAEERFSVQQYLSQLYGAYGIPIAPISAAMAGSRI